MKKEPKNNNIDKYLTTIKEKPEGRVKKFFRKIDEILSKKWLVKGSTTILLILIIFAIYMGVTVLLDKVTLPEVDCTTDKVYSLSEETKTKISNLDKNIKITLINYSSDSTLKSTVDKYRALNKKIEVEVIDDLTTRNDIAEKYSLQSGDNLIIINCGDKETTLSENDLYEMDYTTYSSVDRTEEAITNAIVDVISDVKPKIYFMNNHTMYASSYFTTLMQSLKDDANEIDTIDLFANLVVPEDCDLLVITTLKEDITETEKNSILDYIDNGGEILVLTGASLTGEEFPLFNQVLDAYGVKIEDGVIFEGNKSNMLNNYPDIIIANVPSNSTTKNIEMNLTACLVDASSITYETDEERVDELGVEYESLITTTSSAFIRTNLNISSASRTSEDSEAGSFTVGLLATKKVGDKTSKLVVYSTEFIGMDRAIPFGNTSYYAINLYNNKDIVANTVAYLNEREDTITIRKNYDTVTYTVTQAQHNVILAIIFTVPVVIIVIGIIVWIVRRKRNK